MDSEAFSKVLLVERNLTTYLATTMALFAMSY